MVSYCSSRFSGLGLEYRTYMLGSPLYPMKTDGNHRTSAGNRMHKIMVATLAARKGSAPMKIGPMPNRETAEHTLRQLPTGGEQAPIARPETSTMPN